MRTSYFNVDVTYDNIFPNDSTKSEGNCEKMEMLALSGFCWVIVEFYCILKMFTDRNKNGEF